MGHGTAGAWQRPLWSGPGLAAAAAAAARLAFTSDGLRRLMLPPHLLDPLLQQAKDFSTAIL